MIWVDGGFTNPSTGTGTMYVNCRRHIDQWCRHVDWCGHADQRGHISECRREKRQFHRQIGIGEGSGQLGMGEIRVLNILESITSRLLREFTRVVVSATASFDTNITVSLNMSVFKPESVVIVEKGFRAFGGSGVEGCCSSNETMTGDEMTTWRPFIC